MDFTNEQRNPYFNLYVEVPSVSFIPFLFLVTFGNKITKILRNLCLHFAWQYGQDGKKMETKLETKVTKNQNSKIWDERNIKVHFLRIGSLGTYF